MLRAFSLAGRHSKRSPSKDLYIRLFISQVDIHEQGNKKSVWNNGRHGTSNRSPCERDMYRYMEGMVNGHNVNVMEGMMNGHHLNVMK
jgi:hypothetical protein